MNQPDIIKPAQNRAKGLYDEQLQREQQEKALQRREAEERRRAEVLRR